MVIYGEEGYSFDDPNWVFPRTEDFSGRIPERLRRELAEARDLALSGYNLPVVLICGRVLEGLASAHNINERTLVRNLERMHQEGFIPAEMLEWAHELRALRNIAAHFSWDDEITAEDADDALALTEAILDYIYVFAERFQAFKDRRNRKAN
jgi:hypothetical protein